MNRLYPAETRLKEGAHAHNFGPNRWECSLAAGWWRPVSALPAVSRDCRFAVKRRNVRSRSLLRVSSSTRPLQCTIRGMWKIVAVGSLSAAIAAGTALGPEAARASQQEIDLLRGTDAPPNAIWLDSLDLSKMVQRRQTPRASRSLAGGSGGRRGAGGAAGPPGSPITLGGVTYQHGIGTLSINELIVDLKGQATRFRRDGRAQRQRRPAGIRHRRSLGRQQEGPDQRRASSVGSPPRQGRRRSHRRSVPGASRSTMATT